MIPTSKLLEIKTKVVDHINYRKQMEEKLESMGLIPQGSSDVDIDPTILTALINETISARKVIGFYAREDTYGSDDVSRTTGNKQFDIVCFDFDRNYKNGHDLAGKRARDHQSKYGDEK